MFILWLKILWKQNAVGTELNRENQTEFSTGLPYLQYGKSHWNVENQRATVL